MSADPKLVEIARAAERDLVLPPLRLSTAGRFILGKPGPSSTFNEATGDAITDELWKEHRHAEGGLWSQKKSDAVQARFDPDAERLKEGWGPAATLAEPDPPENLTLFNAVVWAFAESSGMRLPVVRVRIDAVNAWWTGGGEPVKGASGGGWFAFVSLPIGQ